MHNGIRSQYESLKPMENVSNNTEQSKFQDSRTLKSDLDLDSRETTIDITFNTKQRWNSLNTDVSLQSTLNSFLAVHTQTTSYIREKKN